MARIIYIKISYIVIQHDHNQKKRPMIGERNAIARENENDDELT
jgi:hypothetical protein